MSNYIQKQNIFYKGRIYIDCALDVPSNNQLEEHAYLVEVREFEQYLSILVSYPYLGTNLKDGQVVIEGVDYELQLQKRMIDGINKKYWPVEETEPNYPSFEYRTVAIPKEQLEEKKVYTIEEVSGWMSKAISQNSQKPFTDIQEIRHYLKTGTRK